MHKIKRKSRILGIGASIAISTIIAIPATYFLTATKEASEQLENPKKTAEVYSSELQTNQDTRYRFFTKKDFKTGLEDIKELVEQEIIEEHWNYSKGLWVETGYDEWTKVYDDGSVQMGSSVDMNRTKKMMQAKELTCIHIHPFAMFNIEELKKGVREKYQYEKDLENVVRIRTKESLELKKTFWGLPSEKDIYTMAVLSEIYSKTNPKGRLKSYVASPCGVVEYNLTPKGIENFKNARFTEVQEWAQTKYTPKMYAKKTLEEAGSVNCKEKMTQALKQIEDKNLSTKFYTYEELMGE